MTEHVGRSGKRTREQRTRELLRRSKSAQNKYSIGGIEKTKGHKPKAVTLADTSSFLCADDGESSPQKGGS